MPLAVAAEPRDLTNLFKVGSLKGVLSTASYEARKHGVRSGMAGVGYLTS